MARVGRGMGGKGKRKPIPSAEELQNIIGFGADFIGAPLAASRGEFKNLAKQMLDSSTMEYYKEDDERDLYDNLAGRPISSDTLFSRSWYEVSDQGDLVVPGELPADYEDDSPADITVVPTSTTNYQRPRTVAAGYDPDEEKMTVVFRDGTFYNYYDVDEGEWQAFKASKSKGQIIARLFDYKPRGNADESQINEAARKAYYQYSRGIQIKKKGVLKGQKDNVFTKRGNTYSLKKKYQ